MERLTKRYNDEDDGRKCIGVYTGCIIPEMWFEEEREYRVLDKLATYEDLEEQDLLVRLPCKVGTEVFCFFPRDSHYTKCQIKKIEICPTIFGKICYFAEPVGQRGCCFRYFDNEFGKTIFLTREEAEKKLEEMKK